MKLIEFEKMYFKLHEESKTAILGNGNYHVPAITFNENSKQLQCLDLVIPDKISYEGIDYNVIRIEDSALKDCKILSSIDLPETIKWVDRDAFNFCTQLKKIVFRGNVRLPICHACFHKVPLKEIHWYGDALHLFSNFMK